MSNENMINDAKLAAYWSKLSQEISFSEKPDFNWLKKHINFNSRILDYGCGYGRLMKLLYQEGYQSIHGIDFSHRMIERGKQNFPQGNFIVNSKNQVPFLDEPFDCILLFSVLTCISDPLSQEEIIKNLYGCLKSGGIIYLCDYLLATDDRNIKRYNLFS